MWKDIEGFEGLYQISTEGQIRSLDRLVRTKCGSYRVLPGRFMKFSKDSDGYFGVGLTKGGHQYSFRVNRLVAINFLPNPNNFPVVHHKDCDITNNCVDNLEWTTVQDNTCKAVADGRFNIDPVKIRKASYAGVARTRKPVRCIETGQEFYTISDVRSFLNFQGDVVKYIALGSELKGLHFEFVRIEDKQYAEEKRNEILSGVKGKNHHLTSVRCIETGQVYRSQIDAEHELGLCYGYVLQSIKKHSPVYGKDLSFEYVK